MSARFFALLALFACLAAGTAGAADKVRAFEADSLPGIVASHAGKPFVVVVWSLDCDYCQPSFKALAQAQRRNKLAVVTIATDRAGDSEAVRFMRKKIGATGLSAQAWAFGDAPAEQLRYAIDPKWRGEMPRSYWFDSHGGRIAHSGVITAETVAKLAARPGS
jgi:thiol-disulfide isomerase/thioredoxin